MPEDKIEQLCDLFNQMIHQYGKLEKEIHTCGINISLHLSDTHTIVAIGKNTDINITNLAKLQGISKSAASQMVSKLVKRGLVQKSLSPETDNEVILSLTQEGQEVFQAHEKQHQWLRAKLTMIFEKYPEDTIDTLMKIGIEIQDMWRSIPDNK